MKKVPSYSFIKPHVKPILSLFSLIWISLIAFICVGCILVNIIIKILSYNLEHSTENNGVAYDDYMRKIAIIKEHTEFLKAQQQNIEEIFASNLALKRSVQNIFDIVPDTITLDYTELREKSLIIKGKTPSKEAFLLLMEAPLKSIFNKTKTTFYQLPNGWLNFTCVSSSEEEN